jgi:hypothetical protein
VCRRRGVGPHFVQDDGNPGLRDLPGRFAAGEAAADHVNGLKLPLRHPTITRGKGFRDQRFRRLDMPRRRYQFVAIAAFGVGFALCATPARADRNSVIAETYPQYSVSPPTTNQIVVCHDFGCQGRAVIGVTAGDRQQLAGIMASGRGSAKAERAAVAQAGAWFDRRIARAAGTVNHVARAGMSYTFKPEGQLDCIDTSRNTTTLLLLLDMLHLLRHHSVDAPRARGFLFDGKPPHATAVLLERATGKRWSVDAWTRAYGQKPEIMALDRWLDED